MYSSVTKWLHKVPPYTFKKYSKRSKTFNTLSIDLLFNVHSTNQYHLFDIIWLTNQDKTALDTLHSAITYLM